MKRYRYLLFFLLMEGLIFSTIAQEVRRAIPIYASQDQVAQLLAGIRLPENSSLSRLQLDDNYSTHSQTIQGTWSDYREERFDPMRQWAESELHWRCPSPSVVRYLFSGPDILSVMALFPEAPTYILCAKEPVGKMIHPEMLSPEQLQAGLADLRENTDTFLKYGYFITKEMRSQMTKGPFQGVLPLLLTFLALSDHQILAVDIKSLRGASGVRIRFRKNSSSKEQVLFYAQANVDNDVRTSFFKWMSSFGPGAAYLKADSYLPHEEYFSRTRNFLLKNSTTILEDDSGIPLRFFPHDEWALYLFGDYKSPLEIFQKYYQPDLYMAYTVSPLHGPMPFGTGYQFNPGDSGGANLLLAVKRTFAPKAVPVR